MAGQNWHNKSLEEVATTLQTDLEHGLDEQESVERFAKWGPNELPEKKAVTPLSIFLRQFNDFMIWVLFFAVILSGVWLGETVDAVAILAIIVLNAVLGFVQEYRAELAMAALKELAAPGARVIRSGHEKGIKARELVPGDIVVLEAGDIVPADARLAEVANLMANEASLTGESAPVAKDTEVIGGEDLPLGELTNKVYLGTTIVAGRGKAIVVATGKDTEMGAIAEILQTTPLEKTPLQVQLKQVGKRIAVLCLIVAAIVVFAGVMRGYPVAIMLLAGVSLAVAAIPEGLPAVVTVALALGVQSMARRNAILRRLHAVETLGSTTVICTDKTGTLTQNEMKVKLFYWDRRLVPVSRLLSEEVAPVAARLAVMGLLCNDARFGKEKKPLGDPTEVALLVIGEKMGFDKKELEKTNPREAEIPFDSHRKRMTTVNRLSGDWLAEERKGAKESAHVVITKGAPEIVLEKCTHVVDQAGRPLELTPEERKHLLEINADMAGKAYRTLGLGYRVLDVLPAEISPEIIESGLIFAGLVGMTDPVREEVYEAIRLCKNAHIEVVMVTGDHVRTAEAVAKEIGLWEEGAEIMDGVELESVSEEELSKRVERIRVYARVAPLHKVKIVNAFKSRGHVVAMTGDGINDAPAIKRADIGIAMGVLGTDVTKQASDMVLADDNFATIVSAVKEGRLVYDNIKKFVLFLLSCNMSEVLTMFLAMTVGLPLPLLPIQILWVNLVTDGLPALALGMDPPEADLMKRPPREPSEEILAANRQAQIFWQGVLMTIGALGSFAISLFVLGSSLPQARTIVFTTLVIAQLLHSLNFRSARETVFSGHSLGNRFLVLALLASVALQLNVIYFVPLQPIFHTAFLGLTEWAVIMASALLPLFFVDRIKVLLSRRGLRI